MGEAHWTIGQERAGKRAMRRALAGFEGFEKRTEPEDAMRGKALARLGHRYRARRAFQDLIRRTPDRPDLFLEFADTLVAAEFDREARQTLEKARPEEGKTRRFRREEGTILIQEKRFERAASTLVGVLREGMDDAATYGDLGMAMRHSGNYADAVCAWDAALRESPELHVIRDELRSLRFESRPRLSPYVEYRFGASDEWASVELEGHIALWDERWMAELDLRYDLARGVVEGSPERFVEDEWYTVEPQVRYRFHRQNTAFVALGLFAGRTLGPDVGPRAGVRITDVDPYWFLDIEAHWDTVMDEVGAAAALGGTRRGVQTNFYMEPNDRWWFTAGGSYDRIGLIVPGQGREWDGWATWRGDVGYRICKSEFPGVSELSARLDYSASRHLGDRDLARVVPLGPHFDFLTGRVRAERRWARTVGGKFEVYAGRDLGASGLIWGAAGELQLELQGWGRVRATAAWGSNDRFQNGEFGSFGIHLDLIR